MARNGTLQIQIVGDSGPFERTMSGIGSNLSKFGMVAGAALAGVGVAAVGAAVKGVQAFADLERGMNEVFTLLPGISDKAMSEMTDDVRGFAVEMGVAADDVVPALYQAISAGVPQGNVFDFLEIATQASIGGVTDLETAVDGITSVVNAYGEEAVNAQQASDLMFTAVRLGKTDFEQLSASLFNVIPTASALGVEFGDVTAALATLTAQGVPTSVATTQLRQLFVELSKAGGEAAVTFQELSGQSFQEFVAEGGNVAEALRIMRDGAADSDLSLSDMFGSVEAGAAALALSQGDFEAFESAIGEMGNSAGATEAAFQTMDEGLSRSWDRIKVVFSDLLIELGERIAPALQRFADWFEQNLPAIIEWFDRVGTKAGELGTAIWTFWTESAQPAIAAFVGALQENWPTIQGIFSDLGGIVQDVGGIVSTVFGSMASDVDEKSTDMEASVTGVVDVLAFLAEKAKQYTGIVNREVEVAASLFSGDFDRMGRALVRLNEGLARWAAEAGISLGRYLNSVGTYLDESVAYFRRLPGRIRTAVGNMGSILVSAGRAVLQGFWNGLREKWNAVASWLGGLGSKIQNLKGPLEVDRVLLADQGQAIIGGLGKSMEKEWANVERLLGTITAEIPVTVASAQVFPSAVGTDRTKAGRPAVPAPSALMSDVQVDVMARKIGREIVQQMRTA